MAIAWLRKSTTVNDQLPRAIALCESAFAMVHSWCLLFAGVWIIAGSNMAQVLDVYAAALRDGPPPAPPPRASGGEPRRRSVGAA